MITKIFKDRTEAGQFLAEKLLEYRNRSDVVVLALPRGGVPVGFEVATALGAPLDVFVVRKLGVPGFEEYAMGAIASGGVRVLDENVISGLRIPGHVVDEITTTEILELGRA
jgi:predicted phosphoribosyltransferase